MTEHIITVEGVWQNDSTAGIEVFCMTCSSVILYSEEGLMLPALLNPIEEHKQTRSPE